MITAVGICPHPPFLLRANAGLQDPAPELRAACVRLAADLAAAADAITVVTGTPEPAARPPLGGRVAAELLAAAGWTGPVDELVIGAHRTAAECATAGAEAGERLAADPRRVAVLVMADGSAKRQIKAPGHLDPRAEAFDARFVAAAGEGDRAALAGLEPDLARALWFSGRAPLHLLAAMPLPWPARTELRREEAPFGVQYVVALWTLEP